MEVSLVMEELRPPPRQIVSPSAAPEALPTPDTPLLSDRDTTATRQQIRRGDQAASQASSEPSPLRTPLARPSVERNLSLRLSETELAALGRHQLRQAPADDDTNGTPDLLPEIRDGEVTLLNAKADRFAVFVRRVALQVFNAIKRRNWQTLPYKEVVRISDSVTVRATMSVTGDLLGAVVTSSSGSAPFDAVVREAAEEATWDRNPPPGATHENGTIEFEFQARTWSVRTGKSLGERRWLFLGTGLR